MDSLWLVSGRKSFYLVPDSKLIIDKQGELLPYAAACEESAVTPAEIQALFEQCQIVVLAATESLFNTRILAHIPAHLPKVAFFVEKTPMAVRDQLIAYGVDGYASAAMGQDDYAMVLKKINDDRKALSALQDEIKSYTNIAFTAMSSASEMSMVAVYAEKVQTIMDLESLAKSIFSCMSDLGVQGLIQFTFDDELVYFPKDTSASYKFLLETAIGSNARIVSNGRFLLFNFTQVQLLVIDAPFEDSERCGRLRDLLAQLVSITESRARTLKANSMLKNQQENARTVMMLLEMASKDNRNSVKEIMMDLSMSLRSMAMGMDLTLEQETKMLGLAEKALSSLEGLQEATLAVEEHFRSLLQQLNGAASLLEHRPSHMTDIKPEIESNKIELF